jgi:DNA-directed RNA polymerase specialized sigma24 family protein
VAIRAAIRAAKRDVCSHTVEPAILAATMKDSEPGEELFDICKAMKQLTEKQSDAIDCCVLRDMSLRDAAKEMGIAAGTLGEHVSTAKERLKEILPPLLPPGWPKHFYPSALASHMV